MDSLNAIKDAIAGVAPTLGSMIGGPYGAMAGKIIAEVLTGHEDSTSKEIMEAYKKATPEQLIELKQKDTELKSKMIEAGIEIEHLENTDRQNARKRELRLSQQGRRDYIQGILTIGLLVGFFGILSSIMFFKINPQIVPFAKDILILVGTLLVTICNYHFGSSKNTADKIALLHLKNDVQ